MSNSPQNASLSTGDRPSVPQNPGGPPTKHQLALMIWVAVFPTLTVINLTIGPLLEDTNPVLRTFVLATIAVPIVIYVLMPRLHGIRARVLTRRTAV
jgi:antibiotic biosynthesis monooxygenase (ABM) superfamily enzyme